MSTPALTFHGMNIDGLYIPPFSVASRASVCIQWPVSKTHPGYMHFLRVLLKKQNPIIVTDDSIEVCRPLHIYGKVLGSEGLANSLLSYMPIYGANQLRKSHLLTYHIVEGDIILLVDMELENWIRETINLKDAPLTSLEACDRTILSLALACKRSDIVIFDTYACNPETFYLKMNNIVSGKTLIECRFVDISKIGALTYNEAPTYYVTLT